MQLLPLTLLLLAPGAEPSTPTYDIGLRDGTAFVVGGVPTTALAGRKPEAWPAAFAVYTGERDPDTAGLPALLGTYRVDKGVLRFEPRFPLRPGVAYTAVFRPTALGLPGDPVRRRLSLPRPPAGVAAVVHRVYPTADRLAENQLKFYVHFSAPMARGDSYRFIHLLDASGKETELPFLELGEELWDPSGRRFTLFFDPGRIKRGLKPREDVGPSLVEGRSYTLVIDRDWPDAEGNPLREAFRKSFRVGPPDDTCPELPTWRLGPPRAGSREALTVVSPEPLDHALFERLPSVRDADGRTVAGVATVEEGETRWRFVPEKPWAAGTYRLVVPTHLEDRAGNTLAKPFDVDVFHQVERRVPNEVAERTFEVRP